MKKFNIYNMNLLHIDKLVKLERQCFSSPWSYDSFKEELENKNAIFLVAIDDKDNLLGYIGFYDILKEGYIANIAVKKEYRGYGIATKLINEILLYARQNNLEFITLEVRESNVDAIKLYERLGFKKQGKRTNFYSFPREDALIFTLFEF